MPLVFICVSRPVPFTLNESSNVREPGWTLHDRVGHAAVRFSDRSESATLFCIVNRSSLGKSPGRSGGLLMQCGSLWSALCQVLTHTTTNKR